MSTECFGRGGTNLVGMQSNKASLGGKCWKLKIDICLTRKNRELNIYKWLGIQKTVGLEHGDS